MNNRFVRRYVQACGIASAVAFVILAVMYGRLLWLN